MKKKNVTVLKEEKKSEPKRSLVKTTSTKSPAKAETMPAVELVALSKAALREKEDLVLELRKSVAVVRSLEDHLQEDPIEKCQMLTVNLWLQRDLQSTLHLLTADKRPLKMVIVKPQAPPDPCREEMWGPSRDPTTLRVR